MVSKYSLEIGNLLCKLALEELLISQDCNSSLSKNCLLPFEKKIVIRLFCNYGVAFQKTSEVVTLQGNAFDDDDDVEDGD